MVFFSFMVTYPYDELGCSVSVKEEDVLSDGGMNKSFKSRCP